MGETAQDARKITAIDAQEAAEICALWQDWYSHDLNDHDWSNDEPVIVEGHSKEVMVRDVLNRALYRFLVEGETVTDISIFGDS
jgi:hypothetical protein